MVANKSPDRDADGCPILKPGVHQSIGFWAMGVSCDSFRKYSIPDFVKWLETILPAVSGSGKVLDHTGIAGEFDFRIRFERQQYLNRPAPAIGEPADAEVSGAPTIFSAITQQIGLKLKPVKAALDVLVIDHADKDPIEN
jgi:uncharacterized protein (TIGR03435 family)